MHRLLLVEDGVCHGALLPRRSFITDGDDSETCANILLAAQQRLLVLFQSNARDEKLVADSVQRGEFTARNRAAGGAPIKRQA